MWGLGERGGCEEAAIDQAALKATQLCTSAALPGAAARCRGGLRVQVVLWAERSWRPPSPRPTHAGGLLGGFSPLLPCFSPSLRPRALLMHRAGLQAWRSVSPLEIICAASPCGKESPPAHMRRAQALLPTSGGRCGSARSPHQVMGSCKGLGREKTHRQLCFFLCGFAF